MGTRTAPLLFAISALLLSAACSTTPGLALTATPSSIGGDGQSTVTATAKVTAGGGPAPDGTVVHFSATDGIFESMGEPSTTPLAFDAMSDSGSASVQLIVPRRGRGSITITATASFNSATVTQSQVVNLVPAGGLATSLSFDCNSQNVGGFVTGRTDPIHVLCTAKAFDSTGAQILNASIEPFAEAGSLAWQTGMDNNGNEAQFLVYTIAPNAPGPVDVEPLGPDGKPRLPCPATCINAPETCDAEPCWVDNNGTHNPRDGVATLMVAVPGAAGFNSQGEPYVDVDDSGAYESGETYIDVNGNGKYDAPDGTQQDTLMLWRAYRVIWSGSAYITTPPTGPSSRVVGTVTGTDLQNLTVRFNDSNFNKLAATAQGDGFSLASNCTQGGTLDGLAFNMSTAFDPNPGILFDPDTGGIDGAGLPSSYRRATDTNLQTDGDITISGNMAPSTCAITATATRTYDPGAEPIYTGTGMSSSEAVSGTFSFQASSDGGS